MRTKSNEVEGVMKFRRERRRWREGVSEGFKKDW